MTVCQGLLGITPNNSSPFSVYRVLDIRYRRFILTDMSAFLELVFRGFLQSCVPILCFATILDNAEKQCLFSRNSKAGACRQRDEM